MEELQEIEKDQCLNAAQISVVRDSILRKEEELHELYKEHYELMQQGEMISYNLKLSREVD